jgi:hypothetical protein
LNIRTGFSSGVPPSTGTLVASRPGAFRATFDRIRPRHGGVQFCPPATPTPQRRDGRPPIGTREWFDARARVCRVDGVAATLRVTSDGGARTTGGIRVIRLDTNVR